MGTEDAGSSPGLLDSSFASPRVVIIFIALVAAWVMLTVWPGPMLWQDPRLDPIARVVVRDPAVLDLPHPVGTVAATVIAPWDEPVRLGDGCARRAVVSMPAGWTFDSIMEMPGWSVVEHKGASVTIEIAPGAKRLARSTFLGSADLPVSDIPITIQRVCGSSVSTLGTLHVTAVDDQTQTAESTP